MLRLKIKKLLSVLLFGSMCIAPFPFIYKQNNNSIKYDLNNNQIENKSFRSIESENNINSYDNTSLMSLSGINGFGDYNPFYSDVYTPNVTTNLGIVGKSKDSKKVILTSYSGLLLWGNEITNDIIVKDYYKNVLGISDISQYTIKSWIEMGDFLPVLFSDSSNNNATVIILDINTGRVYTPSLSIDGSIDSKKSVIKVADGTKALYNSSLRNSFYSMADGSNTDMANKSFLITISSQGVSSFDLGMGSDIAKNSTDKFIGFAAGSPNDPNNKQYMMFMDNSTKEIYVSIVDKNLKKIKHYDLVSKSEPSTKAKFEASTSGGTITNENKIPRHQYTVSYSNNKTNVLFMIYGKKSSIYAVSFDNDGNSSSHETVKVIDLHKDKVEIAKTSISIGSNELLISTDKTDTKIVFGKINFEKFDDQLNFESIKDAIDSAHRNKAWEFSMVKNSENSAYIYYNPNLNSTNLYYEFKNNNVFINPVQLNFKKYNVDISELESMKTTSLPSMISHETLLSKLTFTGNDNHLSKSINNLRASDANGTLKFRYGIRMNNWWDSRYSQFFYDVSISGFYDTSKINFYFVTSSSDDNDKYNKINELKKTKYASEITKDDVKNHFLISNIMDKNNESVDINIDMITLIPSSDNYSLTVRVALPSDRFPSGVQNINGLLVKEQTYTGFNSTIGYEYDVVTSAPSDYLKNYPSLVTFNSIIKDFANLGPSYSISSSDWEFESNADDFNGTLTINKLIYKAKNIPESFPESNKNIITSPIVYTGFKSTINSLTALPTMTNVSIEEGNNRLPTQIWKEYKTALDANKIENLEKTTLFKVLKNPVTVKKDDIVLELLNKDTADSKNIMEFSITIKDNAPLNLKDSSNKNVVFDEKFKNKLLETRPNYYPFKTTISVIKQEFSLSWNSSYRDNEALLYSNDEKNVIVDLDVGTFSSEINHTITASDFYNNFDSFIPDILDLFRFSNGYQEFLDKPIIDNANGMAWVKVDFVPILSDNPTHYLSKDGQLVDTISKQVIIRGFKVGVSPVIVMLPLILSITFSVSLVVLCVYMYIRLKTFQRLNDKKFSSEIDDRKLVVEDFRKKQLKKENISLENAINIANERRNQKIENEKNKIKSKMFKSKKYKQSDDSMEALDFMSSKKTHIKTINKNNRPTLDDFKKHK